MSERSFNTAVRFVDSRHVSEIDPKIPSSAEIPGISGYHGTNFLGTLWLFNIAMENCPFIDGLSIKNGDFP
jgi:hypothetical protein